ncbi:GNAT family N-acetyltransferase [Levilactobacillus bambusae]|uniref:GNAT family N-acetyltransferase n=1 Tax=Levilactobacillus bambusae TaxID=2024736 RepID=A0A2V1MWM7_9LACO|nr:GNAT family N-acetyltransferase [Levilactobacillus bambusae]PWF99456.1 GNAT family N-acetyltransferase [Levilactobacillus bambusae]
MSEEVVIRVPQPDEAGQVMVLLADLQRETTTFTTDLATHSQREVADQLAQINESPTHLLLVAEIDQRLVAILSVTKDPDHESWGELGVAVKRDFWHLGLGTAMIQTGQDWVDQMSQLEGLVLTVQDQNDRASSLYEYLGFQSVKNSTHAVTNGHGDRVRAHEMKWRPAEES